MWHMSQIPRRGLTRESPAPIQVPVIRSVSITWMRHHPYLALLPVCWTTPAGYATSRPQRPSH